MIRLARVGARKQPHYRIVVIEKDRARNGRSIEVVGTYNPRTEPTSIELKSERIEYWTGKGAQLSETVGKLLVKHKAAAEAAPSPVAEAPAPKAAATPAPKAEETPVAVEEAPAATEAAPEAEATPVA
jgi:small subunit ribosomal protein S16